MLKEIPYNTLMSETRNYEILLRHDLADKTFTDIAIEYEIPVIAAKQIYYSIKKKQMHLYIHHLSLVNGHEDVRHFREWYETVFECYQDDTYAVAYLEKKYKAILTEYRTGEPGMPQHFIESIPPFKPEFGEKLLKRLIEMRETEKKSYLEIGNELQITPFKARYEYELFYHKKVMGYIHILQSKTDNRIEKDFFLHHYHRRRLSTKNRYEILLRDHPELLKEKM